MRQDNSRSGGTQTHENSAAFNIIDKIGIMFYEGETAVPGDSPKRKRIVAAGKLVKKENGFA